MGVNFETLNIQNNLTTDTEGSALDATQGKNLDEKKLDKSLVVDNLMATVKGSALDATQGKVLDDKITQTNADLTELSAKTTGYIYSTDEVVIGKWIDGRNLYRKVFNVGQLSSGYSTAREHGITNFDRAIYLYGSARNTESSSRFTLGLPYPENDGSPGVVMALQASSTNISIYHPANLSRYSAVVIMEYIKTAD